MTNVRGIDQIIENLFLGGYAILESNENHYMNLNAIINVAHEVIYTKELQNKLKEHNIQTYHFQLADTTDYNIRKFGFTICELIHILLETKQKVYVHCLLGISRSATIIILYLIIYKKMSYDEAYLLVQSKRNFIKPNNRFVQDLKNIYKELNSNLITE